LSNLAKYPPVLPKTTFFISSFAAFAQNYHCLPGLTRGTETKFGM